MTWKESAAALADTCAETFGESAEFSPKAGGGPHTLRGIFDENHVAVQVDAGVPVSSVGPALGVMTAELPVVAAIGDTWTIRSKAYRCTDVQPDSEGHTLLLLQEK